MELVDDDGRRWVVRSVRMIGRNGALISWLLWALVSTRQFKIEQELEAVEPMTLIEAQARVCAWMKRLPQDFGAADETDPLFTQRIADVYATRTIGGLLGVLGLDSFMAY